MYDAWLSEVIDNSEGLLFILATKKNQYILTQSDL